MFKNNDLKKLRKSLKLTQTDMANLIGKSQQAYGFYETGRITPDIKTIEKIANVLNVSVNYFFDAQELPHEDNTITIYARGGGVKKYKLSQKKLQAIEALLEADNIDEEDNF